MPKASHHHRRRAARHQPQCAEAAADSQQVADSIQWRFKTWHNWMLFGLGWPSVLLFCLSTYTAFAPGIRALLLTLGWLSCGSWWVSTVWGLLARHVQNKHAAALKANLVMACVGSCIGCIALTRYAYYDWPMLYVAALAVAFALMFFVRSLVDEEAAATRGGSKTDAALLENSGRAMTLVRFSAISRSLSAPQAATVHLLEQAAAMAQQHSTPQGQGAAADSPCTVTFHAAAALSATAATATSVLAASNTAAGGQGPAQQAHPVLELTLQQALAAGVVALVPVDAAGAAAAGPEGLVTFDQAAAAGVLLTGPLYIANPAGGMVPAVGFVLETPAAPAKHDRVQPQPHSAAAATMQPPATQALPGSHAASMDQTPAVAGVLSALAAPVSVGGLSLEDAAAAAGVMRR